MTVLQTIKELKRFPRNMEIVHFDGEYGGSEPRIEFEPNYKEDPKFKPKIIHIYSS